VCPVRGVEAPHVGVEYHPARDISAPCGWHADTALSGHIVPCREDAVLGAPTVPDGPVQRHDLGAAGFGRGARVQRGNIRVRLGGAGVAVGVVGVGRDASLLHFAGVWVVISTASGGEGGHDGQNDERVQTLLDGHFRSFLALIGPAQIGLW